MGLQEMSTIPLWLNLIDKIENTRNLKDIVSDRVVEIKCSSDNTQLDIKNDSEAKKLLWQLRIRKL